jgi:phenylpropionate dioxygenase-like ring-hydroxylating dioxygenase large terminal subunit
MQQYKHGWFQVAFEDDFKDQDLIEGIVGNQHLVLARTNAGIQAFDAACPHRGANLAYGGRLEEGSIVCPFHGYRVALGECSTRGFQVRQYPTLTIGGLVLVRLSEAYENGLSEALTSLDQDHYFVAGFVRDIKAKAALVIENGFDNLHFRTVHNICNVPRFRTRPSQHGELAVEGVFEIPPPQAALDRSAIVKVPFLARAFSPGLVISQLQGELPYVVITSATPTPDGFCRMRLSIALLGKQSQQPLDQELAQYLIEQSKIGIALDETIWEHLIPDAPTHLNLRDSTVLEFNKFCRPFEQERTATQLTAVQQG